MTQATQVYQIIKTTQTTKKKHTAKNTERTPKSPRKLFHSAELVFCTQNLSMQCNVSEEETPLNPERGVARGRLGCDERDRSRGEEVPRQQGGKEENQDRGAFREAPTSLQPLKDLEHVGEFHGRGGGEGGGRGRDERRGAIPAGSRSAARLTDASSLPTLLDTASSPGARDHLS